MANLEKPAILDKLISFFWQTLPSIAFRVSRTLGGIAADGLYLTAWPRLAAFAPIALLLIGFLIGCFHFAPGETFTFSIIVMSAMLIVGGVSASTGGWLWLGYIFGDFLIFQWIRTQFYTEDILEMVLYVRVPILLSYILLAMLLVLIPFIGRQLIRQTFSRAKLSGAMLTAIKVGFHAVIQAALMYVWVNSVPTLIRPVYTWQRNTPPIEAIAPLQRNGIVLVVLSALIGAIRMVLEHQAFIAPVVRERAIQLRAMVAGVRPFISINIPVWASSLIRAAFITLLLSGLITTWIEALLLIITITLITIARRSLISRETGWKRLVLRVPLIARVAVGAIISYYVGFSIIGMMWQTTDTFQPLIITAIISLLVFAILLPSQGRSEEKKAAREGRQR